MQKPLPKDDHKTQDHPQVEETLQANLWRK